MQTRKIIEFNISQIIKLPMIHESCEICSSLFICSQCSKQLDNLCNIIDNYIESDINDTYDEISSIELNDNSNSNSNIAIEKNLNGKIILRDCICKCNFECRCLNTLLLHTQVIKNVNTLKFISQNLSSEL
jgi:hypothetical protein